MCSCHMGSSHMAEEAGKTSGMSPLHALIRCSHGLPCGSKVPLCISGLVVYHLSCFSKLMLFVIPSLSFLRQLRSAGEKELLAESITWM